MALTKYKFGDFIQQRREKYDGIEELPRWGVSKEGFIHPKQADADTSIYNVFYKHDFVFNPARMELNSIALNMHLGKAICSSLYEVFYVSRPDIVLPEYLNLYIKRDEFARKCWFEAVGSARNYFRVANLAEFDIELPSLAIQQKYVNVYKAMLANQQSYERGLEDLKLVCDSTVEDFKKRYPIRTFGQYIRRIDERNSDNKYRNVKNVSVTKEFSEVSSKVNRNELSGYKLVKPRQITFVQTTHNEHVFCNALNNTDDVILVTSVNEVFECDERYILPEYLCINFNRSEFDRYARFNSWGSARETFTWSDLIEVEIPIPPVDVQQALANLFRVYRERKFINQKLKDQIKDVCPILIMGSIEEARREA